MHPDAVQDILEGDRFQGMISTIRPVTDAVDTTFATIITFVAFFIIAVALLRNVLAGAYCAFPKFWDQVAKAHEENENKAFYESVKGIKDSYKTASMGTLKTAFMRIVPNIKCLTEFEDDTLSAKHYFIKAIPQMIVVVIIGVFIYNGYYRDVVSMVADTGSQIIDRTLLSFDPIGTFDTIMNTAGRPTFATDDSIDMYGKNRNKIANDIYSNIIAKYTDIRDANSKAELASKIDMVVDQMFPESTKPWFGNEDNQYTLNMKVDLVKDFNSANYTKTEAEDKDKFQYCYKVGVGREGEATTGDAGLSQITFDSTVEAVHEEWYLRVIVKATRNAVQPQQGLRTATIGINATTNGVPYVLKGITGLNNCTSTSEDGKYTLVVTKDKDEYTFKIEGVEGTATAFKLKSPITFGVKTDDLKTATVTIAEVNPNSTPDVNNISGTCKISYAGEAGWSGVYNKPAESTGESSSSTSEGEPAV